MGIYIQLPKQWNAEDIIEEIEFGWEICAVNNHLMNASKGIPLHRLYDILARNIPEFKTLLNGTDRTQ